MRRQFSFKTLDRAQLLLKNLSASEKSIFGVFILIFFVSTLVLLHRVNDNLLVVVPARGGEIVEGVVGSPRFINPLLATTDADRDLVMLVYSGLMRATSEGNVVPDLARSYTLSDDGKTYTFVLRENVSFHDGSPVTADDIVFTVNKLHDPLIKSPRKASWDGVIVQKIDKQTVQFVLPQTYSPFLENTTMGILPKHIWENANAEDFAGSKFNIEPIGSGPFKIHSIKHEEVSRSDLGIPRVYTLKSFKDYALGRPFISRITMRSYGSEEELVSAYIKGDVDAVNSISARNLAFIALNVKDLTVNRSPLPRIFGVFFNQNQAPVLAHLEVRKALQYALDTKRVVNEALGGNGAVITSPIPPGVLNLENTFTTDEMGKKKAISLLENNEWSINEETELWEKKTKSGTETIAFSLATSDVPDIKEAAQIISKEWGAIGIPVDVKVFGTGDIGQSVIRPRKYDALFYGEVVGRELDLYAFWHSSQRNDPGLNVALYANITSDKLLEDIRITNDNDKKQELYRSFVSEIADDVPAVFVYSPYFIYIVPENVYGISTKRIGMPSERFLNVHKWYIKTDAVWKVFAQ